MLDSSLLDNPSQHVGCKWRLKTKCDGIIEGILSNYYPGNNSFTFDKSVTINEKSENEFIGTLGLFRGEIKDAIVIDRNEEIRIQYNPVQKPSIQKDGLIECRILKRDLKVSDDFDDKEEVQILEEFPLNASIDFRTQNWKAPFSEKLQYIFASTEKIKNEAISEINCQRIIGVAAIGNNVTRFGFIECLLISTDNANYVFCEDEWINLKQMLESRNVIKVIYGSPPLVDLLFKKYNIQLQAVEDLQFLELTIREREQKLKQQQRIKTFVGVKKYSECLQDYLSVEMPSILNDKNFSNVKATYPSELFDLFCKFRVMPLKQLRCRLVTKLFEDIDFSMQLFVHSLCASSDVAYEAVKEMQRMKCSAFIQRRNQIPRISMADQIYTDITLYPKGLLSEKSNVPKDGSSKVFAQIANESNETLSNFKRVGKLLKGVLDPNEICYKARCTPSVPQVLSKNNTELDDDCQIFY